MKLYDKAAYGAGILGAAMAFGGLSATSDRVERVANYLHPEARQSLENLGREERNLDAINLSIKQVNDVAALCSCIREYAPARAEVLERELNAFNANNMAAKNKVLVKMNGYRETPEIAAYEKSKQTLSNVSGYGFATGIGLILSGMLTASIGDLITKRKRRKSPTFVPSTAP